ncbi:MAG: type II toxin-antitoxin system HicB family antitoxin [Planctomycetota bacterium]
MVHKYEIIIYWSDEDKTFVAEVPEPPGCAAHGDSPKAALSSGGEAIELWIDTAKETGRAVPAPKGRRLRQAIWASMCGRSDGRTCARLRRARNNSADISTLHVECHRWCTFLLPPPLVWSSSFTERPGLPPPAGDFLPSFQAVSFVSRLSQAEKGFPPTPP